ncbi:formin-like protein 4 [Lathyrus oleraceus]|uniref:Formin-like protein n=1 Tax=Pisum sativum TaxID=3888 RepID=A0A9D4YCU2_PEA|nr:formin-like protein 4 [Pisum sativum]KAI5437246.1 hypothetical protein KIW84_023388 [Pisum sativum]
MALNMMFHLLSHVLIFQIFLIQTHHCQLNSPQNQNIETFYPIQIPQQSTPPKPQASPPSSSLAPTSTSSSTTNSSSNSKIVTAVAATAAGTLVLSALVFFFVLKCFRAKKKNVRVKNNDNNTGSSVVHRNVVPPINVFEKMEGNIKGLIVDEDGLDVVYWRKLQDQNFDKDMKKGVFLNSPRNKDHEDDQRKNNQETHLLRGKSSTSHMNIFPQESSYTIMKITPPAPPPPIQPFSLNLLPSSPKKLSTFFSSIPNVTNHAPPMVSDDTKSQEPPPPPPPPPPSVVPDRKSSAPPPPPPPPPPILDRKTLATPPPPPPPPSLSTRKISTPAPPPPPKTSGLKLKSSSKPPPTPLETKSANNKQGSSSSEVKLKPLHWDKVNTNLDHSMVWDKIDRGSFRVDDGLMEALFGYVAAKPNSNTSKGNESTSPSKDASTNAFILDPRKSQNTAIVLKSLAVSRKEIVDALIDGQGLNADTIEKLSRIAPTEEEQSHILEYEGDTTKLAAAESFLYHILKAVPSAFKRLNAILFRLNYDSEIKEIREILQTLEMACKELRNQGVFVKLLEAVLKAGNRMNAGTNRGNAQAFNLVSLRKLSDVKSVDGKTTLLHFVVEEVVRSEGKRAVLNRNHSLTRGFSRSSSSSSIGDSKDSATSNEQKLMEYIKLGLPIVGGVSAEFSNAKKIASTDYNSFAASISTLSAKIVEIRQLVSQCGNDKGGKFVREMNRFLESSEKDLQLVREEQTRIMQLVKRTTDYYQGGGSKDSAGEQALYLFVIVKDFLGMVDQACIEIARNMQKKKTSKAKF